MNKEDETRYLADYEQTTNYFHALHEVRFKLLAFLPLLTGGGVLVSPSEEPEVRLVLACLGLVVTLGITSYDQRNTQIFDRLILRARVLEGELRFISLEDKRPGGAFSSRSRPTEIDGIWPAWHVLAVTFVYSASITGWVYLGVTAFTESRLVIACVTAGTFVVITTGLFVLSRVLYKDTMSMTKDGFV